MQLPQPLFVMQWQQLSSLSVSLLSLFDPSISLLVIWEMPHWETAALFILQLFECMCCILITAYLCVCVSLFGSACTGGGSLLICCLLCCVPALLPPSPPPPFHVNPPPLAGLARRVSIYLDRSKQGGEFHHSLLYSLTPRAKVLH